MITLVIPALNESEAIATTVTRATRVLQEAGLTPSEIVVIDDGSIDGTGNLARKAGARVITHPHNIGYGRSLKDGIQAARYDIVAISDADGTYPLEDIPRMVEAYGKGFDMVVGARSGEHYRESPLKTPLRAILRRIVEFTTTRKVPDINSGLRVFSRGTIMRYFPHLCDTFSFTTSMTLAYMMTGQFVLYIPITYHKRVGETKVHLFKDSLLTLQYIIEMATYYNPLRIFMLASMMSGALAFISIIFGVVLQVQSLFWLGVGSLLMAVLILALGLLAVLLKQIMDRT